MRKVHVALAAFLIGVLIGLSGCAQIMGTLRRDLDEGDPFTDAPPTTGGRWSERGLLADDGPGRGPASGSGSRASGPRSWLTADHEAANRRDSMRGRGEEGDDEEAPNADTNPYMDPGVRRQYKNGSRATRADFVDESQNEGSLWASDGQTNYYFTKNKIRGVGDILTINLEADLVRDIGIEARRTLTPRERDFEMNLAQERLRAKAMGLPSPDADPNAKDQVASSQAAPAKPAVNKDGTPAAAAAEPEIPSAQLTDVDMGKSLAVKTGDTMMAEIVERYPNGNYKVRATKRVPYKGGVPRMVTLVGVVKGTDIAEDDTVPSGKLYEYRVETSR